MNILITDFISKINLGEVQNFKNTTNLKGSIREETAGSQRS